MEQEKTGWGGAREGAGRKAYAKEMTPVCWRVSKQAKAWIDEQAREQGVTTARIIDQLIQAFEEQATGAI